MFRFRVAQDSMSPNLRPGEEFVATTSRAAVRGEIVATEHPKRPGFWLVKRLTALGGDVVAANLVVPHGQAWILSDNDSADVVDSRTFGPVDAAALHPVVTRLDEDNFVEGVELLIAEDPQLAKIIEKFSIPPFWSRSPGFATLVLLILEQQVSLESGAAVFRRLLDLVGPVTPETIAARAAADLNTLGLTRQKAGYVIGLARDILEQRVDIEGLTMKPVDEALATLQSVKGIGPWTAEAYLLSAERRPDVFPLGDRALQVGTGEALGMSSVPTCGELEILAEPWRPIRSVAARIIWHGYLSRRGRSEPPSPFSVHGQGDKA